MVIWTMFSNPFTVGGSTHTPTGCEVEVGDRIDLGKGYFGYEVTTPKGNTIVCEATTGAMIGSSASQVKNDILEGDDEVMGDQIKQALKHRANVRVLPNEEFWRKYGH